MNNKRLTEIIDYYEQLSLEAKAHIQVEKQRIENAKNNKKNGKRKKLRELEISFDGSSDPYDESCGPIRNLSSSDLYNPYDSTTIGENRRFSYDSTAIGENRRFSYDSTAIGENRRFSYDSTAIGENRRFSYDELINLDMPNLPTIPTVPRKRIVMPQISQLKSNVVYYCSKCKLMFKDEKQFHDHILSHSITNSACYCRTCNSVFENDIEYYEHVGNCQGENTNKEDNIPTDPNGEYECPTCHQKYNNAFFVGEHFMKSHNDYSVLCELDHINHNGFPGFEILKTIDMIDNIDNKENEMCEVCCFNFEDNIFVNDDEIKENDRSALIMKCCQILICRDCLMNHIIESDSIICPFCRKDHTRTDWNYITYIEPKDTTDRDKWLPWWEDHIEIFSYR